MQQILSIWSTLTPRRRVTVIAATLAMFMAVLGVSRMASQPSMALLYAGLDPAAAGDVVAALDQQGVRYDVRNGAILVEGGKRDALRMTLAAEGLPATEGQGYELLDQLTGFGTTSQMFDAAYWRAKEGELARTIASNTRIKGARVHISNPSSNPFQRSLKPTASVTVTTTGGPLASAQARALKFLVASAVAGLAPEDVAIIDGRGGLVMSGDETAQAGSDDKAVDLRRNIQRLLEARVGFGNAVVEVNVETVTEREAITEHRFDPDSRVAISTETEERSTTTRGTQSDSVTVASNLPEGDAAGGENSSSSENSESRERVNFEVSETTREVLRTPGAIKRISVAVLVDGIQTVNADTNTATWAPRPDEEIAALRDLVASAIGFDAERGDNITLKSMEFEPLVPEGAGPAALGLRGLDLDVMSLIQLGVLALVSLALGLFVVRPILITNRPAPVTAALSAPDRQLTPGSVTINQRGQASMGAQSVSLQGAQMALTGEIDDRTVPLPRMSVVSGDKVRGGNAPVSGGDLSFAGGDMTATGGGQPDPVKRLRQLIEDRREESVEILRSWMDDTEEQV